MFWSRISTTRERSRPTRLNSATVTNESMSAIDVADARWKSLAIAAVMSVSKFFEGGLRLISVVNEASSPCQALTFDLPIARCLIGIIDGIRLRPTSLPSEMVSSEPEV
jgi:hypothetical protein